MSVLVTNHPSSGLSSVLSCPCRPGLLSSSSPSVDSQSSVRIPTPCGSLLLPGFASLGGQGTTEGTSSASDTGSPTVRDGAHGHRQPTADPRGDRLQLPGGDGVTRRQNVVVEILVTRQRAGATTRGWGRDVRASSTASRTISSSSDARAAPQAGHFERHMPRADSCRASPQPADH